MQTGGVEDLCRSIRWARSITTLLREHGYTRVRRPGRAKSEPCRYTICIGNYHRRLGGAYWGGGIIWGKACRSGGVGTRARRTRDLERQYETRDWRHFHTSYQYYGSSAYNAPSRLVRLRACSGLTPAHFSARVYYRTRRPMSEVRHCHVAASFKGPIPLNPFGSTKPALADYAYTWKPTLVHAFDDSLLTRPCPLCRVYRR